MRVIHPRHGTHAPTAGSPPRRPGSVRRTTSIDMLRPDGVFGPVHLLARGRDLVTPSVGEEQTVATADVVGEVAYLDGRALTALHAHPDTAELAQLVGQRLSSGFRARVDEAVPEHREQESVLYQILDDLPVATLISGYVLSTVPLPAAPPAATHPNENLCAGWRTGGTIMVEINHSGRPPMVTGPLAPPIVAPDDPVGWHGLPDLPEHAMRRVRRTDIWRRDDGTVAIDSFFRDSHMSADGEETAIHEYTITATVDPSSATLLSASAQPGALPWTECPPASASATRVAGTTLRDVRTTVRTTLVGTTTCTHLNDQLRSLAGVAALLRVLPG
jgi:Protein of unknown function (DUF2889)